MKNKKRAKLKKDNNLETIMHRKNLDDQKKKRILKKRSRISRKKIRRNKENKINNLKEVLDKDMEYTIIYNNSNTDDIKDSEENSPVTDFKKFTKNKFRNNYAPWITDKTVESIGIVKLHYEILDFYNFMTPTEEENTLRLKTFSLFKNLILSRWPHWKAEMFGSFPNNTHLPDSDIDVVVHKGVYSDLKINNSIIQDSLLSEPDQLNLIYTEVLKKGFVDEIRFVHAKVPIIKMRSKLTGVRMDISYLNFNNFRVNRENGCKAMEKFRKILVAFPFIRPLIILIKFVLRQKSLNETFTGGVSSYLLLNMIYAYFLHIRMIGEHKKGSDINLGSFFKGFLEFYSEEFNFRDLGISLRGGLNFFSKWQRNFSSNENLCFENFQEPEKDIGKGAYQFPSVVRLFREILCKLFKSAPPSDHSYLSLFINRTAEFKRRSKVKNDGN